MDRKLEIIVIGAGAAGLMAAAELLKAGHAVTILEARARTGGRIHTIHEEFSFPVEAGAEFIHGNQMLTQDLLRKAGIPFTKVTGDFLNWHDGKRAPEGDDPDWKLMMKKLDTLTSDETLESFLKHNFDPFKYQNLWRQVTGFVEGYDAADIKKVSVLALREEWRNSSDEDQYRITGGYGSLKAYLEKQVVELGGKLHLSQVVKLIEWKHGTARIVSISGKVWTGQRALITVPLGVLQHGQIHFSPPLGPHQEKALQGLGFGNVTKFLLEFDPSFWEKEVLAKGENLAFIFSDAAVPTWWTQSPAGLPLLTGWHGGPSVLTKPRDSDSQLTAAIQSLAYLFECSATAVETNIVHDHITNWTDDPYSRGAYAYPMLGSQEARQVLGLGIENTLYFGGEALYSGPAMGTVEAALHSGQKAVREMLNGIGR
jgi:monoamine oxidase